MQTTLSAVTRTAHRGLSQVPAAAVLLGTTALVDHLTEAVPLTVSLALAAVIYTVATKIKARVDARAARRRQEAPLRRRLELRQRQLERYELDGTWLPLDPANEVLPGAHSPSWRSDQQVNNPQADA